MVQERKAGMSRRRGVVVGRRGEVGVGDVAGLGLDDGVGLGNGLLHLPEIVVRQHDRMPTVLLGHRAILRRRVGKSKRRDAPVDAGRARPKVANAVWPERRGFGPARKEAPKVVLEEALSVALMGTLGGLPITVLGDNLRGHLEVSPEGSPIVDLDVDRKVDLKVGLTVAPKASLSVDLRVDPV